jgi:DNA invertase Pin-like site-specific DNA recombinase
MNTVRIGYARVSGRSQDHQLQLDALAAADCREVVVETASSRSDRPKLRATLRALRAGDTLVIYKPDRIARSMKELLVLLEDELHSRDVNLHILTGICAGLHKPNSASIADKMLFMVAAMAAEMERDLIRECTLDGLAAAQAQGRKGGKPPWSTRTPSRSLSPAAPTASRSPRSRGVWGSAGRPYTGRSRPIRAKAVAHPREVRRRRTRVAHSSSSPSSGASGSRSGRRPQ